MIMSARSTPVQIFISIHSAGAYPQISKILRFCETLFPGYTVFFLGHAPRSNPWIDFHRLWFIRRGFTQGRSFYGVDKIVIHLGVISPPQKKISKKA